MPFIDVTDVLTDPDFADEITVRRRAETINGYGEADRTVTTISGVSAVVTVGSQKPLERNADGQVQPNTITVHSMFRLLDARVGQQPDVVTYNGQEFTVKKVFDWSRYGAGFICAECEAAPFKGPAL